MFLGQFLERANGFLAIGRVVKYQRDLLAADIATVFVQDMSDRVTGPVPVVGGIVEDIRKHAAILGRGAPIAHGVQRNAISCGFGDQLIGDTGRERLIEQRAIARPLGRLVAFHAFLGIITGFAFHEVDLFPADTAIALVEQSEVVLIPVRERNAVRGIGSGPIAGIDDRQVGQCRPRGQHGGGHCCQ